MGDFLDNLARNAMERIENGYYDISMPVPALSISLKRKILESKHAPIISEIKTASPSLGTIRKNIDVKKIAMAMEKGGAVGISVLTEPKHFGGSLAFLTEVWRAVKLPLLMKDIVLSPIQLKAASNMGANAILLIEGLFERGYCECDVNDMIAQARSRGLEVLLETHSEEEFSSALNTSTDLIGINNRDLKTLKVNLETTKRILNRFDPEGKVIVSESGIKTPADIRFLQECGANAFLIGSSIMMTSDIEKMVKEFVMAL
jgi:indole-3-glycerol phosphate synthase